MGTFSVPPEDTWKSTKWRGQHELIFFRGISNRLASEEDLCLLARPRILGTKTYCEQMLLFQEPVSDGFLHLYHGYAKPNVDSLKSVVYLSTRRHVSNRSGDTKLRAQGSAAKYLWSANHAPLGLLLPKTLLREKEFTDSRPA